MGYYLRLLKKLERKQIAQEARRRARNSAPKAGATRKIEDKRRKPAKHKKPLRGDE